MAASDFDTMLRDCLDRMARGENVAACLARYPLSASQLEPSLTAAEALTRLGAYRMPEPARTQEKARMRRELAARSAPATRGIGLWHAGWLRGLAGFAAVLLFVVMLGNVVAASRPGDFGYAMRAAAERAPARLSADMVTRSRAELRAAERRLADLDSYLELGGSSVSTAIASLLAADEAAMRAAVTLSEPERSVVAARIVAHGETLRRLAIRAGDPQTGEALWLAAQRASAFGLQLQPDPQPDRKPNLAPTERSAPAPTQRMTLTATARPQTHTPRPIPMTPRPAVTPRATSTPQTTAPSKQLRSTPTADAGRWTQTPGSATSPGPDDGPAGPEPGNGDKPDPGPGGDDSRPGEGSGNGGAGEVSGRGGN